MHHYILGIKSLFVWLETFFCCNVSFQPKQWFMFLFSPHPAICFCEMFKKYELMTLWTAWREEVHSIYRISGIERLIEVIWLFHLNAYIIFKNWPDTVNRQQTVKTLSKNPADTTQKLSKHYTDTVLNLLLKSFSHWNTDVFYRQSANILNTIQTLYGL